MWLGRRQIGRAVTRQTQLQAFSTQLSPSAAAFTTGTDLPTQTDAQASSAQPPTLPLASPPIQNEMVCQMERALRINNWQQATDLFSQIVASHSQEAQPQPQPQLSPTQSQTELTDNKAPTQPESSSYLTSNHVSWLVNCCAINGRHEEIQTVMDKTTSLGVQPSLKAYAHWAAALALHDKGREPIQLLMTEVAKHKNNKRWIPLDSFDPLLRTLRLQKDFARIHSCVNRINKLGIKVPHQAYQSMLVAAAASGQKHFVLRITALLHEMKKKPNNSCELLLETQLRALLDVNEPAQALRALQQADRNRLHQRFASKQGRGLRLMVIKTYAVNGEYQLAKNMLRNRETKQMRSRDPVAYSYLFSAFEQAKKWEAIMNFYRQIRSDPTEEIRENVWRTERTCHAVLCALKELQRMNKIDDTETQTTQRDIVAAIDKFPETTSCHRASQLIDALDSLQLKQEAQKLFDRAQAMGCWTRQWMLEEGFVIDLTGFESPAANYAFVHAMNMLRKQCQEAERSVRDVRVVVRSSTSNYHILKPVAKSHIKHCVEHFNLTTTLDYSNATESLVISKDQMETWLRSKSVLKPKQESEP